MANFNPSMIVPVSKSSEFAEATDKRTAKTVLLEGIAKQIDFYANPTKQGRRWFERGQKETCITLRISNKPLKLMGEETKVVVPADQFVAAMEHFKNEVVTGKFDGQLTEAEKMMDARKDKLRSTRAANKAAKG